MSSLTAISLLPLTANAHSKSNELHKSREMMVSDSEKALRSLLAKPLTVRSAVQIALLNNREAQATLEEVDISRADLLQAGLLKNPQLYIEVRPTTAAGAVSDIGWSVSQDFLDLLMRPLRKKVAATKLAAVKMRVADEMLKLATQVKTAFYTLQAQQELIGKLKLLRYANQLAVDLAQKQFAAGNISDLQLLDHQGVYSQSRLDVAKAEAEAQTDREKLNRLLGTWGRETGWKITSDLPRVPGTDFAVSGLESRAVAQRLDLKAARTQLWSMVQALGMTKKFRFIGGLDFGVSGERGTDGETVLGPALGFEIPIFNHKQGRIAKMHAQFLQAKNRFEALAVNIRSQVRQTRNQMLANRDVAKFYRDELLPERRKILAATQRRYNGMYVGLYGLLLAKQNEIKAERNAIDARRDYWIARAELERTVGGSLPNQSQQSQKSNREAKN